MNRLYWLVACVGLVPLLTAPAASADGPAGVPKQALEALNFFVGDWESEDYENGVKIGTGRDQRKWAPGKYCLTMEGSGTENGVKMDFSGISGWEAKTQQLLEHWRGSDGIYVEICYPLRNMQGDLWEGTHAVVFADGKTANGECQLKRTPDGFIYTARWKQNGKEFERKSVARRVTPKASGENLLREFGELLVGRWIGDVTLVADLPGVGKQGEKLTNHLTYRWIADRRGIEGESYAGSGTGKGMIVWDPAARRITEYRITSGGSTGTVEYTKKNGQWLFKLVGYGPDGADLRAEGSILIKDGGNTLVFEGPSSTVGGKKTLKLHDVYKRAGK